MATPTGKLLVKGPSHFCGRREYLMHKGSWDKMPYRLKHTEHFFTTPVRWSGHTMVNISCPREDSEGAKHSAKSYARSTAKKCTRIAVMTGSNDHEYLDRRVEFFDPAVLPLDCIVSKVVANLEEICHDLSGLLFNKKSKLKIILQPPRNQVGYNVFLQKLHATLLVNKNLKNIINKII